MTQNWDDYSKAVCTCGESVWPVPPKSKKLYRKEVKCPHCEMEWVIKRYPGGRAEMRVLKYVHKP